MAVVYLPLHGLKIKRDFTEGDYESYLNELLTFPDFALTFIARYPRLFQHDLHPKRGTQGTTMDYTASHPWSAVLFTIAVLAGGVFLVAKRYYDKEKRQAEEKKRLDEEVAEKKDSSHRIIFSQLHKKRLSEVKLDGATTPSEDVHTMDGLSTPSTGSVEEKTDMLASPTSFPQPSIEEVDDYLEKILEGNADLRKRYNRVYIENGELLFDKKEPEAIFTEKPASEDESAPLLSSGDSSDETPERAEAKSGRAKKFVNNYITKPVNNFIDKYLAPLWKALGLTVFTYWIMYAVSGLFGGFGGYGPSMPAAALGIFGFGVPILTGLIYLGMAAFNYLKHEKSKQAGIHELADSKTAVDGVMLLHECQKRYEYDMKKKALEADYGKLSDINSGDYQQKRLGYKNLIKKNGSVTKNKGLTRTWLTAFVTSYITMQYIAWIVVDITFQAANVALSAIPLVNLIAGGAFFVIAAIHSSYKAYQKYQKAKEENSEDLTPSANVPSLEALYEKRMQTLGKLDQNTKNRFTEAFITIEEKYRPKTKNNWDIARQVGKIIWNFTLNMMTGAMLARMFSVSGSAILLPFAAAALANPYTIAIIVLAAVGWGLFQVYKTYQEEKEQEAKEAVFLEKQRDADYVHAIELADLQIAALRQKAPTPDGQKATLSSTNLSREGSTLQPTPQSTPPPSSVVASSFGSVSSTSTSSSLFLPNAADGEEEQKPPTPS